MANNSLTRKFTDFKSLASLVLGVIFNRYKVCLIRVFKQQFSIFLKICVIKKKCKIRIISFENCKHMFEIMY